MPFTTLAKFFEKARAELPQFEDWANKYEPNAMADHICFKCGTPEEFEALRKLFEPESEFIYQSIISKRRIAVIKFKQLLETTLGQIWLLELSDQKPDGSQASGFDHIEIYPRTGTLTDLVQELESKGAVFEKVVRPHHTTFDLTLESGFKIRLEEEALIEKIKREEMF
jgi:predicted metalloenzyme YecM